MRSGRAAGWIVGCLFVIPAEIKLTIQLAWILGLLPGGIPYVVPGISPADRLISALRIAASLTLLAAICVAVAREARGRTLAVLLACWLVVSFA